MIQTASENVSPITRIRRQQYISEIQRNRSGYGALGVRASELIQKNTLRTIYGVTYPLFSGITQYKDEWNDLLNETITVSAEKRLQVPALPKEAELFELKNGPKDHLETADALRPLHNAFIYDVSAASQENKPENDSAARSFPGYDEEKKTFLSTPEDDAEKNFKRKKIIKKRRSRLLTRLLRQVIRFWNLLIAKLLRIWS